MPSSERRSNDSLLERARRGSNSALNRLLASCRRQLKRKAEAELARKQDASDVVQECQLAGAARFDEFKGHRLVEFHNWMGAILQNLILHQHRYWGQKKRDRKREQSPAPERCGQDEPAGSTTSILSRLVKMEQSEQLMIAAGWCRKEDWAVIVQHLYEDQSHAEIAAALNVSHATVRQRYFRAVRSVGEAMKWQELMTGRGIAGLQQDIIGLHHFQKADPPTIAERLQLSQQLVADWLAEAKPLIREFAQAKA
jgi:RNA polymerase sigma factor (sigma-70 family)